MTGIREVSSGVTAVTDVTAESEFQLPEGCSRKSRLKRTVRSAVRRHLRHLAQVWTIWRMSMSRLRSRRQLSARRSGALKSRQATLPLECPRSASAPGRP